MDTTNPTAPAAAPNVTPSPAAAAMPAAPVAPDAAALIASQEAFTKRLQEERLAGQRELLRAFGVDSPDKLKASLDEAEKLRQAQMSEAEKMRLQLEQLTPKARQADEYKGIIAEHAATQLAAAPPELAAYVKTIAGEDPAAQLRALTAAQSSGLAAKLVAPVAAPVTTPPAAPPAKPPNPANTMSPPGPGSDPPKPEGSKLAQYNDLRRTNPVAAATFRKINRADIEREEEATRSG